MEDVLDVKQKAFLKWYQASPLKKSSNAINAILNLVWQIYKLSVIAIF